MKNIPAIIKKAFYTIIALKEIIITRIFFLLLINAFFLNFYSKTYKIIIKFNNKSAVQALNSQSPKNIIEYINLYIKTKNIIDTDI